MAEVASPIPFDVTHSNRPESERETLEMIRKDLLSSRDTLYRESVVFFSSISVSKTSVSSKEVEFLALLLHVIKSGVIGFAST